MYSVEVIAQKCTADIEGVLKLVTSFQKAFKDTPNAIFKFHFSLDEFPESGSKDKINNPSSERMADKAKKHNPENIDGHNAVVDNEGLAVKRKEKDRATLPTEKGKAPSLDDQENDSDENNAEDDEEQDKYESERSGEEEEGLSMQSMTADVEKFIQKMRADIKNAKKYGNIKGYANEISRRISIAKTKKRTSL